MSNQLDFVKGHCGWDVLSLVLAEQVPEGDEFETALKIVDSPVDGGIEVGILYPETADGAIPIKILNKAERNWIPMCGGMTQVIGKAMLETFFSDHYNLDLSGSEITINLQTESALVPIRSTIENGQVIKVTTVMDDYIGYLTNSGVELLTVDNIPVARVGYFMIINIEALNKRYPEVDFTSRVEGVHWDILKQLNSACKEQTSFNEMLYTMLFDMHPQGQGQACVYPRFYQENPWEFQCGTGSIATTMGMIALGDLSTNEGSNSLILEWGNYQSTPDPYGIRTSEIKFGIDSGEMVSAEFSHSTVEVIAEGKLNLPCYTVN